MKNTIVKKNVEARLKVHLLQGKSITHNQAQAKFGTNRLAEYIRRLRADGMDIITERKIENGSLYGVYRLRTVKKESRIKSRAYMEQAYPKGL